MTLVLERDARDAPVGPLVARVIDHEVGLAEILELLVRRPDQEVVHEERVIGPRAERRRTLMRYAGSQPAKPSTT